MGKKSNKNILVKTAGKVVGGVGALFLGTVVVPGKVRKPKSFDIHGQTVLSHPGGFLGHRHNLQEQSGKGFKVLKGLGHFHGEETIYKITKKSLVSVKEGGHTHKFSLKK